MKKWPIMMLALSLLASATLFAQGSEKKTIKTDEFTSIGLGLSATVYVMKGDHKVEVEGPASAVDKMKFETKTIHAGVHPDSTKHDIDTIFQ